MFSTTSKREKRAREIPGLNSWRDTALTKNNRITAKKSHKPHSETIVDTKTRMLVFLFINKQNFEVDLLKIYSDKISNTHTHMWA